MILIFLLWRQFKNLRLSWQLQVYPKSFLVWPLLQMSQSGWFSSCEQITFSKPRGWLALSTFTWREDQFRMVCFTGFIFQMALVVFPRDQWVLSNYTSFYHWKYGSNEILDRISWLLSLPTNQGRSLTYWGAVRDGVSETIPDSGWEQGPVIIKYGYELRFKLLLWQ